MVDNSSTSVVKSQLISERIIDNLFPPRSCPNNLDPLSHNTHCMLIIDPLEPRVSLAESMKMDHNST